MRYPLFYKKLDLDTQYFLSQNFNFYLRLNPSQTKLFNHRVVRFIEEHQFIGKEGLWVDDKMKLLIAGTAVMLTFGFDDYLYDVFDKILIYPQDYYSLITQHQHKGETNPGMGLIVFSWQDFKEGIKIKDDNYHLGLHEFAHALQFSMLDGTTEDAYNFRKRMETILDFYNDEDFIQILQNGDYIREYAFSNEFEFFAVLVEHFYESPHEFKDKFPELFKALGNLLQIYNLLN